MLLFASCKLHVADVSPSARALVADDRIVAGFVN